ncbi:MAG: hypothetical protein AAB663_02295 [Patescibacteria group bacterium]
MEFFLAGFVMLLVAVPVAMHLGLPYHVVVYMSDGNAMDRAFAHADEALAAWARGDKERARERLHFAVFSATVANTRLRFVTGRWVVEHYIHGRRYAGEVLEDYDATQAARTR